MSKKLKTELENKGKVTCALKYLRQSNQKAAKPKRKITKIEIEILK